METPTPLPALPPHWCRRRGGHSAGRKVQERRARAAQARLDTTNEPESHHTLRTTLSPREGAFSATPPTGKGIIGKESHRTRKGEGKATAGKHSSAKASEIVHCHQPFCSHSRAGGLHPPAADQQHNEAGQLTLTPVGLGSYKVNSRDGV